MRRRSRIVAGYLMVTLALIGMAGGHWAVLQSIAWAGMIRDYSVEAGSVWEGVAQTFSGDAPCAMCERITQQKGEERQLPSATIVAVKLDSMLPDFWQGTDIGFPRTFQFFSSHFELRDQHVADPPLPVPRVKA